MNSKNERPFLFLTASIHTILRLLFFAIAKALGTGPQMMRMTPCVGYNSIHTHTHTFSYSGRAFIIAGLVSLGMYMRLKSGTYL